MILAPIVALVLAVVFLYTVVRMASAGASGWWWSALGVLLMAGMVAGWFCSRMEYRFFADDLRAVGFPIPLAFFRLEDGGWVDYVVPHPRAVLLGNMVMLGLVGTLPVSLAHLLHGRRADSPAN